MMKEIASRLVVFTMFLGFCLTGWNSRVAAQTNQPGKATKASTPAAAEPLQVQETNTEGVVAEFMECKRKEGVLSVKIRFRNTGAAPASISLLVYGRGYDRIYFTAEGTKYYILKDEDGNWLAPGTDPSGSLGFSLQKGKIFLWWAKYPAPPAAVKKITLFTTVTGPFEDIPITDP